MPAFPQVIIGCPSGISGVKEDANGGCSAILQAAGGSQPCGGGDGGTDVAVGGAGPDGVGYADAAAGGA